MERICCRCPRPLADSHSHSRSAKLTDPLNLKFGALLRNSAAELPELHQLFVSYKQLKKRLKRLPERQELVRQRVRVAGGELPEVDVREVREQEEAFVQRLDEDVQQFNR